MSAHLVLIAVIRTVTTILDLTHVAAMQAGVLTLMDSAAMVNHNWYKV